MERKKMKENGRTVKHVNLPENVRHIIRSGEYTTQFFETKKKK